MTTVRASASGWMVDMKHYVGLTARVYVIGKNILDTDNLWDVLGVLGHVQSSLTNATLRFRPTMMHYGGQMHPNFGCLDSPRVANPAQRNRSGSRKVMKIALVKYALGPSSQRSLLIQAATGYYCTRQLVTYGASRGVSLTHTPNSQASPPAALGLCRASFNLRAPTLQKGKQSGATVRSA